MFIVTEYAALSNTPQNIEQLQNPTKGVTINSK